MHDQTRTFRGLDSFTLSLATAIVACTLLTLAVVYGWLGADVGEGSDFCEALRGDLVNQPANTWSNLGFVFAGLAVGWQGRKHPQLMDGMVGFFACLVVLLGPASAAMHATGTVVGQNLDLTSMFLISSFAASYAMKRWFKLSTWQFFAMFSTWLLVSELVLFTGVAVPLLLHGGNAVFALGLITAIVLEVRLWGSHRAASVSKAGIKAIGAFGIAFTVWLLDQTVWCEPESLLQAHALWHILCAVATFFLFRLYVESDKIAPQ